MGGTVAYLNGSFLADGDVGLSIHDAGVIYGASLTERFRTYGGQPFAVDSHLKRFRYGLDYLRIDLPEREELATISRELLERNDCGLDRDFAVVFVATPGQPGKRPTLCLHVAPQPRPEWADGYAFGWALATSDIRPLSSETLPRNVKHRSRLHWYLAGQRIPNSDRPTEPLLIDRDGAVSETAYGNVIAIRDETLRLITKSRRLLGVTEAEVVRMAESAGLKVEYNDLTLADLMLADEVLLTSTGYTIAPVTQIDHNPIGSGSPGPMWEKLRQLFAEQVGFDFADFGDKTLD